MQDLLTETSYLVDVHGDPLTYGTEWAPPLF